MQIKPFGLCLWCWRREPLESMKYVWPKFKCSKGLCNQVDRICAARGIRRHQAIQQALRAWVKTRADVFDRQLEALSEYLEPLTLEDIDSRPVTKLVIENTVQRLLGDRYVSLENSFKLAEKYRRQPKSYVP